MKYEISMVNFPFAARMEIIDRLTPFSLASATV
jgi:hypothetical protein